MNNTDRHPECHMRTALGNCDPIGGFCTSVNEPICEALHKVSRPQGEWIHDRLEADGAKLPELFLPICQCSECSSKYMCDTNYCPNCGARMEGADDEQMG